MSTSSGGINPFHLPAYGVLAAVSNCCPPPNGSFSCITHPSATIIHFSKLPWSTVQLACVKHAASVRPEPGSNSQIISYSGVAALPLSSTYNSVKVLQHCFQGLFAPVGPRRFKDARGIIPFSGEKSTPLFLFCRRTAIKSSQSGTGKMSPLNIQG